MLLFVLQDICTVVPHWIRYKELIGILEASLQDIVDRWADGKVRFNSDLFSDCKFSLELLVLLHYAVLTQSSFCKLSPGDDRNYLSGPSCTKGG